MAEKKANWVLRSTIGVSLVVHFFLFLHISGIYNSQAISYIELAMDGLAKPNTRQLPVPRKQFKPPREVKTKQVRIRTPLVPKVVSDPMENPRPVPFNARINLPSLPETMTTAGLFVPDLGPGLQADALQSHEEKIEFTSAQDYFDMLNLRIQSARHYPEAARSRHIEGRVKVEFILLKDGSLSQVKVIKPARDESLNRAAQEAVQRATPFPMPPPYIFTPPITLQITILFELA